MPKRRRREDASGSSGGAAGLLLAGGVPGEAVEVPEPVPGPDAPAGRPESGGDGGGSAAVTAGVVGAAAARVPDMVLPEGYESRLNTPLRRGHGEVARFNDLWSRFERGDALTPEERGELFEYLQRRMLLPFRRYATASGGERVDAARELCRRAHQLESFVERERVLTGRDLGSTLDPWRRDIQQAIVDAAIRGYDPRTGARAEGGVDPSAVAEMLRDVDDARLDRVADDLRDGLAEERANLMGAAASAGDMRELAESYARLLRWSDAAAAAAGEYRRRGRPVPEGLEREIRLAERWAASARDTSDVLREQAGALNTAPGREHGFAVGRRAVRLPEPPPVDGTLREAARGVYFAIPPGVPSSNLTRHLDELGVRYGPPSEPPLDRDGLRVVNWGGGSAGWGREVLNRDTSGAADKVEMLRRLGELAPRSTFRVAEAEQFSGGRVVAKRSYGSRGSGKEVLDLSTERGRTRAYAYEFFQEFVPDRDEYRVVLLGDEVLTVHRKVPAPGSRPEDLVPERTYERLSRFPVDALEAAREARRRCGVDLAGVDLIRDRRTGRWYVLEVNSSPGMGRETLARLVQVLAERRTNRDAEETQV